MKALRSGRGHALGAWCWLALGALVVGAWACSSKENPLDPTAFDDYDAGARKDSGALDGAAVTPADGAVGPATDTDHDGIPDSTDVCPDVADPSQIDNDGDHIGDACDCDPTDAQVAAYKVVEDDLSTDKNLFTVPAGFDSANWSFADGAYNETRLAQGLADVSFYGATSTLEDVMVDVRVASTEIADLGTNLRQIMILAGASSAADFSAYACGVEVVDGLTPTQKTSVLQFGGTPSAITITELQRSDRGAVQVNDELDLRMVLRGGQTSCSATIQGVTTTATAPTPNAKGAVGFYARETKALFKNVRICRFPK